MKKKNIRNHSSHPGWGELYDGWEKDIPPQYEHRGPSLAEVPEAKMDTGPTLDKFKGDIADIFAQIVEVVR